MVGWITMVSAWEVGDRWSIMSEKGKVHWISKLAPNKQVGSVLISISRIYFGQPEE